MANSTAPVYIKPTVASNRDDTFVFGAWVCTADGAGSFQCCLTMPPNLETGFVTLPEVVMGELAFRPTCRLRARIRFQLELDVPVGYRMRADRSAIACGPPPRKRSTRGPRNLCRARTEAPSARRAGKEPVPEYNSDTNTTPGHVSDSNPLSGFYSDSAYEFYFG
jgi:hypothetical protein